MNHHFQLETTFETGNGEILSSDNENGLSVTAGEAGTWIFTLSNHGAKQQAGLMIRLFATDIQFAHRLQVESPKRRDYVTVESDHAVWNVSPGRIGYKDIVTLKMEQGFWNPGECLKICVGDRREGGKGSEVFWTTTTGQVFLEWSKDDGDTFQRVERPVQINIAASNIPALIRLLGPTVVQTGEDMRLHIGVFDRNGNIADGYQGQIIFQMDPYVEGLPDSIQMRKEDHGLYLIERVRIQQEGIYRIGFSSKDSTARCVTHPIIVDDLPSARIYWGDLHCHSWGDSTMMLMHSRTDKVDPLERHKQAFFAGRLDFSAPGPMSFPRQGREEIWQAHKEAVQAMDQPGKYVPFLSYEAHPSLPGPTEGDRQVIFRSTDEPLPPDYALPMKELEEQYGSRDDCMLQVHIGGAAPKWELYQPKRERMVEVSSGFGNAEWLLREALHLGYKPAVCGCSDLHLGLLGGPRAVETFRGRFGKTLRVRDAGFGQGPLTAVIANELNRDALWNSFERRSTYATSGERVYLSFSCNGVQSGGEAPSAENYELKIRYYGTSSITAIDLISGDSTVETYHPRSLDWSGEVTLSRKQIPGEWIYVRISQEDGNVAWCSPIWLEDSQQDAQMAERYLSDLKDYLQLEEDLTLFHDIKPIGIRQETLTKCALFKCRFGKALEPMSIRWYYEFPIPKFRMDWGSLEIGERNCERNS